LTLYQSLDDQAVMSLNFTIPIYLIKIKHMLKWICVNFKIKELSPNNLSDWIGMIFDININMELSSRHCQKKDKKKKKR
jgi:hypothetical protein